MAFSMGKSRHSCLFLFFGPCVVVSAAPSHALRTPFPKLCQTAFPLFPWPSPSQNRLLDGSKCVLDERLILSFPNPSPQWPQLSYSTRRRQYVDI
jgi:hypothetical protein